MRRYRKHEKGSGLFSSIEHQQAVAQKRTAIFKLPDLIAWEGSIVGASFDSFHSPLRDSLRLSVSPRSAVDAPRQRNGRQENPRIKQGERPKSCHHLQKPGFPEVPYSEAIYA